jgi:ribonuclease R
MSDRYQRRVLDHVKHEDYTPRRVGDLASDLGVPTEDLEAFSLAVQELADEGLVEVMQGGAVALPSIASMGNEVTGSFRRNARGFGFVQSAKAVREGSFFVAAEDSMDALSGDIVRVKVSRDRPGGPGNGFSGRVVEIVKRKRTSFTGELVKRNGAWLVMPDGRELTTPIIVRDAESKNAREGDKVVIEITKYPEPGAQGTSLVGEGVITRVLGDAGRPDVETQAVIAAYDLPGEFPEECVEQARRATEQFDSETAAWREKGSVALVGRLDLTDEFIITIDPPDAKDYDDAISIRVTDQIQGGGWELGVHIADVAHFIEPGSPLDEEAKDRCNSVYLPRLVIPMLPEVLSNGICSLQEGVPRFCKSAFMTYDRQGNVRAEGVAQTLIKSTKRLTYLEAQALIDGDTEEARKHAKTAPKYTDQLIETLREMNSCARAIRGRRQRQGMISLELPDCVLIFDEHGHVVDAEREDDAFTHTLIEMFMVEANEVLARLFENMGVPLLRRIHPEPVPGDVDDVRKAAMVAGFRIPKNPTRQELQGLLDATRGTSAARAVHMAVLRTLTRAEYSPALIGHFALASEAYAHFTSPIRRYADLTVHRALAEYLRRTDNGRRRPKTDGERAALGQDLRRTPACPDEAELTEIGRRAGQREDNAEGAERELKNFLVLQLLSNKIGEVFPGVVTGINPRGLFVQIDKYLADGFVKAEDLPGDVTRENLTPFWKVDQKTGSLVDQRSGRSFSFGDSVKVKIAAVDLAKRQLELVLDDVGSRAAGKARKIGGGPGGIGGGIGGGFSAGGGAGFKEQRTGSQKRSQRSKSRDKAKKQHRRDK